MMCNSKICISEMIEFWFLNQSNHLICFRNYLNLNRICIPKCLSLKFEVNQESKAFFVALLANCDW